MNAWHQPGYEDAAGFIFMMLIICGALLASCLWHEARAYARRVYRQRRRAQRGGHHR